jgi:hypothetical protein
MKLFKWIKEKFTGKKVSVKDLHYYRVNSFRDYPIQDYREYLGPNRNGNVYGRSMLVDEYARRLSNRSMIANISNERQMLYAEQMLNYTPIHVIKSRENPLAIIFPEPLPLPRKVNNPVEELEI